MRSFVTGAGGFAGQWLVRHLRAEGDEVHELQGDLLDERSVREQVARVKPEACYHLAAQSEVPLSYQDPAGTWKVNVLGTLSLYEALRAEAPGCRTVFAGSCDVYGVGCAERRPMPPEAPLAPANPYAASKAAADLLSEQYARHFGLPVVRLRLFNHTGPGQSPKTVCSDFANRIARIERGELPPVLEVGNLEAEKDFSDVRDVARAYRLAAARGTPGAAYNVGSGRAVPIRGILDLLSGMSRARIEVKRDPSRYRPADTRFLEADIGKTKVELGWEPRIPLEETLKDLLEYWRATPA